MGWDDGYIYTSPAGKFKPNAFGLYDMHGNVWQWCSDWLDRRFYDVHPKAIDPKGPYKGDTRVIRGGAWSEGYRLESGFRYGAVKGYRSTSIGFRTVVPVE
ncbi:MAG: formylglycine-generating enzyme family protein [Phycisphaerae bacterium]